MKAATDSESYIDERALLSDVIVCYNAIMLVVHGLH